VAEIVTGQLDEQALARKLHDDLGVTINPDAGGTAAPAPLVDPARIIPGGPPPDGIPPLDHPKFQPAGSVAWLAPAEPVAAVQVGGQAKAYPLQILAWHEIVNDTVGGVPVSVSYCPLCNTAITWRRPLVDGAVTTFGTSGKVYQSNLVMYDRATRSLWPQALGQAVVGPLTGQRLQGVPTQIVSWAAFRTSFPGGLVLSRDTGFSRPYGRNPYVGYDAKGATPFLFDGKVDPRLGAVERVLGLTVGSRHLAVPYPRLAARAQGGVRVVDLDLAGAPLLVVWRARPRRWTASRSPARATWAPRPRSPGGSAAGCLPSRPALGRSATSRPAASGTPSAARPPGRWPAAGSPRPARPTRSGSTGPPSTPTPPSGPADLSELGTPHQGRPSARRCSLAPSRMRIERKSRTSSSDACPAPGGWARDRDSPGRLAHASPPAHRPVDQAPRRAAAGAAGAMDARTGPPRRAPGPKNANDSSVPASPARSSSLPQLSPLGSGRRMRCDAGLTWGRVRHWSAASVQRPPGRTLGRDARLPRLIASHPVESVKCDTATGRWGMSSP
jgi:Protein of unknown function (DUF3179)